MLSLHRGVLQLLLLVIASVFWTACENDMEVVNEMFSKEQAKVETVEGVQLLYSDSGKVMVKVTAPLMLRSLDYANPSEEFPNGILIEFVSPRNINRSNGRLTAKYAIRNESKNEVIVRDSVVWISGKGERLVTDKLTWDDKNKMLFTNHYVKITKPEEIIYGNGFEADQNFNYWKIINPIGKIAVEGLKE